MPAGAGAGPGAPPGRARRPRDGPGADGCGGCGQAVAGPTDDASGGPRQPAIARRREAAADPEAQGARARSSTRLIRLPDGLVEQGLAEATGTPGGAPGQGQGQLPGGARAARAGRSWAVGPDERAPRPPSHPRAGLRGTGTTTSPRAAIDTAAHAARARGGRPSSATTSEVSLELADRRARRGRAPSRRPRAARRAPGRPAGCSPMPWTAVARSAPAVRACRGWRAARAGPASAAVPALELDEREPGDHAALGVGDQVDRHARAPRPPPASTRSARRRAAGAEVAAGCRPRRTGAASIAGERGRSGRACARPRS